MQVKGAQDSVGTQQPSAPVPSRAASVFGHIKRGRTIAANATARWHSGLRGTMDVTLQVGADSLHRPVPLADESSALQLKPRACLIS